MIRMRLSCTWGMLVIALAAYAAVQASVAIAQQPVASGAKQAALHKADAAFRAGYAAMQAGKLQEARQDFADTVALAPQLPEAHVALGAILVQLDRPEQAIPDRKSVV